MSLFPVFLFKSESRSSCSVRSSNVASNLIFDFHGNFFHLHTLFSCFLLGSLPFPSGHFPSLPSFQVMNSRVRGRRVQVLFHYFLFPFLFLFLDVSGELISENNPLSFQGDLFLIFCIYSNLLLVMSLWFF